MAWKFRFQSQSKEEISKGIKGYCKEEEKDGKRRN